MIGKNDRKILPVGLKSMKQAAADLEFQQQNGPKLQNRLDQNRPKMNIDAMPKLESSQRPQTSTNVMLFARWQHHIRFGSGFPYAPLKAM